MTEIFHLPKEIRQEFSIDESGLTYASQSAVARLCGVTQQAINQLLVKIWLGKGLSEPLKPFAGMDYRESGQLQDKVVAAIINHYAMYARNTTEMAKKVSLCFNAIGLRTWLQKELGWKQQQQSTLSISDAIALANLASEAAQNAGVDKNVSEQIKLEGLMKMYPDSQHLLKPQKEAIAASNPMPEKPMTATEVGQQLGLRLGYPKISARKVNMKLLQLGYQASVTRVKRSTGKEIHDYYQATEKGKPHSTLLLSLYVEGEGKATKAQLRWFESIITILAHNWEDSHK